MIKNIRFSIGADNKSKCVSIAKEYLLKNNYPLIEYGSLAGDGLDWVEIAKMVSKDVQENKSDFGLLFCCTGTGVTIVANKFKGIRAALCNSEQVAEGARKWNDANILGIGLMSVKETDIEGILSTWVNTKVDNLELKNIEKISEIEL
ncbi:RpiB/LacA/LacB family sugar-phosphate isomerase [bacterium]|jgi:ribose 5-phosphate isomerase B|nr:RpiB/LacA/LacB family sugar-phosphate isomerase [bacterium]MBT3794863.1 RpiB/LacA/LacB family sugar-phosphate isomerase [bacterium]MBT4634286.1 RpiB/LacA/LacB family sugar-phosphate isomerase [bacterium]